jgi:hypothetical protein
MFIAHDNAGARNLRPSLRAVAAGAVALAGILAVLLASHPAQAAQPQPSIGTVCNVGGQTTASWSHLKVTRLEVIWYDPATTLHVEHPAFEHATPNGQWSFTTPADATNLFVEFYTDATQSSIDIKCT